MGWMRRAKTSAIAFSSTLTCRFGHTGSARQVRSRASPGGATTEQPWNRLSPSFPSARRNNAPEHFDIGNLIADSVIWRLSKATNLKVISRLSTTVFRGRASDVGEVSAHLGATYVLSGGYVVNAGQILVTAELSAARNDQVVWTDRLSGEIGDLLKPESELAHRIAQAVHVSVFDAEVEHILTQPLPTLESYSLLLGSIKLMHRSSKDEFLQTRKILEELINRHNRIAAPRAWLAQLVHPAGDARLVRGPQARGCRGLERHATPRSTGIRRTRSRWRPKGSSTVTC